MEENGGNDFTPEEDENSIDDVSNKSIGIPDEEDDNDDEEVKVELDLADDLIKLKNVSK